MATEARRRCGYRKVGGLYLVASGGGFPCDRLPFPLCVCPVCSAGIKQTRGWTWIDVAGLLGGNHKISIAHGEPEVTPCGCMDGLCPLCHNVKSVGRAGLLWIGAQFYPTPANFQKEAAEMGMSRRITAIPRGFKVGETWVLFAHPKAIVCDACHTSGLVKTSVEGVEASVECEKCSGSGWLKGAFRLFRPERIEKIITKSQATPEALFELQDKGITPVIVPDDDPDHQGSVYDKPDAEEPEVEAPAPVEDGKMRAAGDVQ